MRDRLSLFFSFKHNERNDVVWYYFFFPLIINAIQQKHMPSSTVPLFFLLSSTGTILCPSSKFHSSFEGKKEAVILSCHCCYSVNNGTFFYFIHIYCTYLAHKTLYITLRPHFSLDTITFSCIISFQINETQ